MKPHIVIKFRIPLQSLTHRLLKGELKDVKNHGAQRLGPMMMNCYLSSLLLIPRIVIKFRILVQSLIPRLLKGEA